LCFEGENSIIEEAVSWLKLYQEPETKLIDFWKKTVRTRLSFIHANDDVILSMVLAEWPRYGDTRGHILVRHSNHYDSNEKLI
jgi:hypothetical protein